MSMDLSGIKMLVTDMDGTLLDSKGAVSTEFFELFSELKKLDVLFVAASGRQYFSIRHKLAAIENDIHIIAENGGMTLHQGVELASVIMQPEQVAMVLEGCKDITDCYTILCGKKGAYIKTDDAEFLETLAEYYNQFTVVDDLATITDDQFMKIAIYHGAGSEANLYPSLKHLEDRLSVKVSAEHWLDISLDSTNKGNALEALQNKFGITQDETIAIGDYNNDLEMLTKATYSFAMENAHPNVKKAANYSTKSNDNNGVEYIMQQVIAAKKQR